MKKKYIKPEMQIYLLNNNCLLQTSGPDAPEYDGPFAYNSNVDNGTSIT